MNRQLLLNDLAMVLENDITTLTGDFRLNSHDLWDSLAMVSMIASVDQHYQIPVSGLELEACNTITDLFNVIDQKIMNLHAAA